MKFLTIWLVTAILIIASPFAHTSAAETFRVMLRVDSFPPYSFEKGDSRSGIIKDLFTALAKETGDTFEYVRVPFRRALYQFETGKIDLEPMCNPIWRQSSSLHGIYSIPFAVSEEIVLFNADKYIPINSPEDLLGKTVGVISGYHYPVYGPYFADGRINPYPLYNENKLIQLLLAGRLDQALMNKDFAQYQIKIQNLKDRLIISEPCSVLDMMIRFHPSKKDAVPRFNKAIEKLLNDGIINQIYDRYR
ncbi:amino acid ABC transporter substrate-binding protein, PAAT family (TC 3.A.1.3.-) [Maridesulfovibrio ferrireducens]|uniref:Amino acid ABC transporter substrate-binding protein, PAAT family (TC 3.A.1.3.-) n=1 Tax=Maridesulfovibrio ferrireducens TaxID=246191 RepID=A0A1G9L5E4_9BACT|nr:transporter substrate-binding domain-containing protein [Maridesulfovibrio ferrireducens]SDL57036.1 amino acid ABC transporter substrate-binding protein, PAAT family (TC 3.A.1.3.-) [Maridesulfovibrio ferrireducens]